jgi:hypothetical protein
MSSLLAQFSPFDAFMLICIIVGGFFAVRNGRQTQLAKFQKDTIDAQNDRIKILEDKIADLEKQNTKQQYIIDTITSGLKQRGLVISVDGEMYPIADKPTAHRKRPTAHHAPLAREKEEN